MKHAKVLADREDRPSPVLFNAKKSRTAQGLEDRFSMNAPATTQTLPARGPRPLAPSLERRRVRIYLAMVLADIAMILVAFGLVGNVYLEFRGFNHGAGQAQLLIPLYLTLALYQRAYSIQALADMR